MCLKDVINFSSFVDTRKNVFIFATYQPTNNNIRDHRSLKKKIFNNGGGV